MAIEYAVKHRGLHQQIFEVEERSGGTRVSRDQVILHIGLGRQTLHVSAVFDISLHSTYDYRVQSTSYAVQPIIIILASIPATPKPS